MHNIKYGSRLFFAIIILTTIFCLGACGKKDPINDDHFGHDHSHEEDVLDNDGVKYKLAVEKGNNTNPVFKLTLPNLKDEYPYDNEMTAMQYSWSLFFGDYHVEIYFSRDEQTTTGISQRKLEELTALGVYQGTEMFPVRVEAEDKMFTVMLDLPEKYAVNWDDIAEIEFYHYNYAEETIHGLGFMTKQVVK